jgi:prolyl-tRNA synthetase
MLYMADGQAIACSVRGDYEINELKLKKIWKYATLRLMTEKEIMSMTGAQIGYAGPIWLSDSIKFFADDSIAWLINFECGVNRTHYHAINANWDRELARPAQFYDFKLAKQWDIDPSSGKPFETQAACEIGNIFPLETKFSNACGLHYMDEHNQRQPVMMWCYGIGPSRIVGVVVERYCDEKWILWPKNIAPFEKIIIPATTDAYEEAKRDYMSRLALGEDVAFDDRDLRFGEKMADWELWWIPEAIIYGKNGRELRVRS